MVRDSLPNSDHIWRPLSPPGAFTLRMLSLLAGEPHGSKQQQTRLKQTANPAIRASTQLIRVNKMKIPSTNRSFIEATMPSLQSPCLALLSLYFSPFSDADLSGHLHSKQAEGFSAHKMIHGKLQDPTGGILPALTSLISDVRKAQQSMKTQNTCVSFKWC